MSGFRRSFISCDARCGADGVGVQLSPGLRPVLTDALRLPAAHRIHLLLRPCEGTHTLQIALLELLMLCVNRRAQAAALASAAACTAVLPFTQPGNYIGADNFRENVLAA